jgi:type VII secretion protein EccB
MTMQSRRDLFQAHRLMTQRAALALLRGEPDIPDQPIRRLNVGTFAGILVAVIVVAGFGIWGLLFHSAPSLTYQPGTLIIDKQTGTNYVFCGSGHKEICPMANHSSALLALQSDSINTEQVNQSSLTSIKHGPLLGIPGLPQDPPASGLLVQQPWSVCFQVAITGQTTTTVAGGISPGGQALSNDALVVDSPNGPWVIWNNLRYPISQDTIPVAFPRAQPFGVPSVWLDAIPQGQPFQAPPIPNSGATVTGPAGQTKIGQLYRGANGQDYVTLQDGNVSAITPLQDTLLSPQSPSQLPLPGSDLVHTDKPLPTNGLPLSIPPLSSAQPSNVPFCVTYSGARLSLQVETGGRMPSGGTFTGDSTSDDVNYVDIPPGKGALVRENGNNVSYFLITNGERFSLASNQVPGYLGYSTSQAVQLPAGLVSLIPAGPGFDPSEANDVVANGGSGSSG